LIQKNTLLQQKIKYKLNLPQIKIPLNPDPQNKINQLQSPALIGLDKVGEYLI